MKRLLFTIVLILVLTSCKNNNSIELKIIKKIKSCGTCKINLNEVTDFTWDKVYIFYNATPIEEIEKAIGCKYDNYKEFSRPWIFIKNNTIIYYENNPLDIENIKENEIIFYEEIDTLRYNIFYPSDLFIQIHKKESGISYYVLKKINNK